MLGGNEHQISQSSFWLNATLMSDEADGGEIKIVATPSQMGGAVGFPLAKVHREAIITLLGNNIEWRRAGLSQCVTRRWCVNQCPGGCDGVTNKTQHKTPNFKLRQSLFQLLHHSFVPANLPALTWFLTVVLYVQILFSSEKALDFFISDLQPRT